MHSYWVVHVLAQKITETTKSLKICCFIFIFKILSQQTETTHQQ